MENKAVIHELSHLEEKSRERGSNSMDIETIGADGFITVSPHKGFDIIIDGIPASNPEAVPFVELSCPAVTELEAQGSRR